ncbi:MAG: GntR family transcriptional regulator [Subdoligranulum variabile]|nr:MAG: GntR family transcriptional regulator [Subdoligranulum variabile]
MAQSVSTEVYSRDAVYRQLRRQIIDFTLLPGELISENTLAAQMHTSRTPVREAIARLESEHCVEVFPQRGTQVSRISMRMMHQAAFLRSVLEREAVEELCRKGLTAEQMRGLEESLAKQYDLYAAHSSYELLEEDMRMHSLFYCYCGRERAIDALTAIDCDMMRVRYLKIITYSYQPNVESARGWENQLTEHRLILDALRRRDYGALRFIAQQHILLAEREGDHLRRIYPQYFCA